MTENEPITPEELIELLSSENEDAATAAAELIALIAHVVADVTED